MRKIKLFFMLVLAFNIILAAQALAGGKELDRIKRCMSVLSEIMSGDLGKAPRHLLCHSKGILIFPGVKKAAFIIGARRGKGVIVIKKSGKWLPPSFVTISGGSFGFQAGAKSSDILLLIMTDKAINEFKNNKLRLGIDIGITAGPVGKETGISSEDFYKTDMFSYVKEKGIFAGVNLSGSVITHDKDSNLRFYKKELTLIDILNKKLIKKNIPKSAKKLINMLEGYCRKR